MTEMIILFVVLQLVNVVLQTLKSIITVKGTTLQSALMNALAYGVYTVIVVFTAGTFTGDYLTDLIIKIVVTMTTNLIGVYVSAWILNKFKKDKLWEIVATIKMPVVCNINYIDQKAKFLNTLEQKIRDNQLSYHYMNLKSDEFIFTFYCKTQKESLAVKEVLQDYSYKYIIHEETVKL